jgi:hypothetical protein
MGIDRRPAAGFMIEVEIDVMTGKADRYHIRHIFNLQA